MTGDDFRCRQKSAYIRGDDFPDIVAVHVFIGCEVIHPFRLQGAGDQCRQRLFAQFRFADAALEHAHILLGGADKGALIAAIRDNERIAVIGQDAPDGPAPQPVELGEMGVERLGLGHIGHGVFERIPGKEERQILDVKQRRVIAVDIGVAQMNAEAADVELEVIFIDRRGQDQG